MSTNDEFFEEWRCSLAPYCLGYKLKLIAQVMYRDFAERLVPYDLTPFQYLVLCCLWEEDALSSSEIAEKLSQLGATLTGVVDRMETRKLVYRQRDEKDRRIIRVWLTEEGKNLLRILPPLSAQTTQKAIQGISEAEKTRLTEILDLMINNFQTA